MNSMDDYVQIMLDSLQRKARILDILIEKNKQQRDIVADKTFEDINWDKFNILVAEKEAEINRIIDMDSGFQALYDKVSDQLKDNKDRYANQIKEMQNIIKTLEEKSIEIRTGEDRNRALIEQVMMGRKNTIRQARSSLKAVTSYYKSMQGGFGESDSIVNTKK